MLNKNQNIFLNIILEPVIANQHKAGQKKMCALALNWSCMIRQFYPSVLGRRLGKQRMLCVLKHLTLGIGHSQEEAINWAWTLSYDWPHSYFQSCKHVF